MRELTSHKCSDLNEQITISAVDEPGPGGANSVYTIYNSGQCASSACRIEFQNGAVKDAGPNGISDEALLAVVEDRLTGFQAGPFECPENREALKYVKRALARLKARTADRIERGVEGHSVK